jgi:hypothetical protein
VGKVFASESWDSKITISQMSADLKGTYFPLITWIRELCTESSCKHEGLCPTDHAGKVVVRSDSSLYAGSYSICEQFVRLREGGVDVK